MYYERVYLTKRIRDTVWIDPGAGGLARQEKETENSPLYD